MRMKHLCMACFVVGFGATVALAHLFTWVGNAPTTAWDQYLNWTSGTCIGNQCWPQTTSDDAVIPHDDSTWPIDLVDEEIDDLTISGDVTFEAASGTPTLTVDAIIFGNADYDVEAEIKDRAKITAN